MLYRDRLSLLDVKHRSCHPLSTQLDHLHFPKPTEREPEAEEYNRDRMEKCIEWYYVLR